MGIMNVLAELHMEPDLKLNLKFEIEVLCKTLSIDLSVSVRINLIIYTNIKVLMIGTIQKFLFRPCRFYCTILIRRSRISEQQYFPCITIALLVYYIISKM